MRMKIEHYVTRWIYTSKFFAAKASWLLGTMAAFHQEATGRK
jgi:hypothetical protein